MSQLNLKTVTQITDTLWNVVIVYLFAKEIERQRLFVQLFPQKTNSIRTFRSQRFRSLFDSYLLDSQA